MNVTAILLNLAIVGGVLMVVESFRRSGSCHVTPGG
jgi:hypothetical protein